MHVEVSLYTYDGFLYKLKSFVNNDVQITVMCNGFLVLFMLSSNFCTVLCGEMLHWAELLFCATVWKKNITWYFFFIFLFPVM